MNLDISLRNVPRKLRMRCPEDIVEWIQIINRRTSTQIMMILVFLLMTMMMKYCNFKQLEELGESTTQTPPDKLPKYIPDRDKLCLSKEQAEHVYEAVENGEQVKPYL